MKTKYHVELSDEERQELEGFIRAGNAPARTQTRARILLLSDQSQVKPKTGKEIASALLCAQPTVGNIRRKFSEGGLQKALYDQPRSGQPPKITDEKEAQLITLACSQPPEGKTRWTIQMLADKLVELKLLDSISDVAVMKKLKNMNLSLGL
jgi:putative transposase